MCGLRRQSALRMAASEKAVYLRLTKRKWRHIAQELRLLQHLVFCSPYRNATEGQLASVLINVNISV